MTFMNSIYTNDEWFMLEQRQDSDFSKVIKARSAFANYIQGVN